MTTFLDLQVGQVHFAPNPHADFITIHSDGSEVTLRGSDFWQYVGECFKRAKIDATAQWMEEQSASSYLPAELHPSDY